MPELTAEQVLAQLRRLKNTGASAIDRRGRVEARSYAELRQIERDLAEEEAAEADPNYRRTRRVVVSGRSGF